MTHPPISYNTTVPSGRWAMSEHILYTAFRGELSLVVRALAAWSNIPPNSSRLTFPVSVFTVSNTLDCKS